MIVPKGQNLGQMLRYVGLPLATLFAWDLAIVLAYKVLHWQWVGSRHIPLALYGGAISVIIGFRNNSAYARWWEARTLWGQVVNNSRSFARQVLSTLTPRTPNDPADLARLRTLQKTLIHGQIAWVHALRQHLRGLPPSDVLSTLLSPGEIASLGPQKNVPVALQLRLAALLRDARTAGELDSIEWSALDRTLSDLINAQGGAERIKNTPMPKQYDFYPRLFVQIYCLLLPIGLVETLGWFTPLGSTVVGFMFLALDQIGRDLEDPFENTIYDLPLTAITTTIETNLRQMLGEQDLPPAIQPVHGVLW